MIRIHAVILAVSLGGAANAFAMPSQQTPATTRPAASAQTPLPAAIAAAFKKAYPTATIKNVSKETEDGKVQYEVESVDNGLSRDINYLADGTIVDIEEEVSEANFPAPVAAAIKARYPKATIARRERQTAKNVVTYEVQLKGADMHEVVLTPAGVWISPKAK